MGKVLTLPKTNRLECSSCGATANAACDCGAPYVPAGARAAAAIADNPDKSDRAIAADLGISRETVRKARSTDNLLSVDTRVGLDGKVRRMPTRKSQDEIPTEEECEKEHQKTLYEHACWFVDDRMTSQTRQRFFAYLMRKYRAEITAEK